MRSTSACQWSVVSASGWRPVTMLAVCVAALFAAVPAGAQTNEEIFEQFQWNFATPGARANAMGQAFIGVADDASAAVTNPAGLLNLTRPQVYFEFKSDNYEVDRFAASDALFTQQTETFGETLASLSFFDIAIPLGSRLAAAFTRHEFLNAVEDFTLAARPIPNYPGAGSTFFPVRGLSEFKGTTYAGSVAFAPVNMLRLGVTASFNQFDAFTRSTRFRFAGSGFNAASTGIVFNESSIEDTSSAASFTFGALLTPVEMVSLGVVYAKGPDFEVTENFGFNPSLTSNQAITSFSDFPQTVSIHVPDRVGVGLGIRPVPRLLIAADVQRIGYSSLAEDFTIVIGGEPLTPDLFYINDGTEAHVGAEWMARAGANPIFIRAGAFTTPYHGVRYRPFGDPEEDAVYSALFNLSSDDPKVTGTVGAGIAVGRRLQIDLAFVQGGDVVASAAIRF